VDDGLLSCSSRETMRRIIQEMKRNFEVKAGNPQCFIGFPLKQQLESVSLRHASRRRIEKNKM
jgi:hypothetical protein